MRRLLSVTLSVMLLVGTMSASSFGLQNIDSASDDDQKNFKRTETATKAEISEAEDLVKARDDEGNVVSLGSIDDDDYDGFIFALKSSTTASERNQIEDNIEDIDDKDVAEEILDNKLYSADSLDTIAEVADVDDIKYIEPDYCCHIDATPDYTPNDKYYSTNEWAYSLMDVQYVWSEGITGAGQNGNDTPIAAIIDTGLAGVSDTSRRHQDLNYSNVFKRIYKNIFRNAEDTVGHGTHVAGIINETLDNSIGACGLMPDCKIIPCKVANSTTINTSDVVNMINYILSNNLGVDVINMSFGAAQYSASLQTACNSAASQGLILVASAGNDGTETYNYPASYKNVISVAALDSTGKAAYYSQHNNKVTCAAPGTEIYSLSNTNTSGYISMSGTSMAAPMVTSLAIMAKSLDSSYDYDKFVTLLEKTSTDAGSTGYDNYYGYGIINFAKAYSYITGDCFHVDTTIRNAKSASCQEDGYTGDTYCVTCGKLLSKGTTIEALGHNFSNPVTVDASCVNKEYTTSQCSRCGTIIYNVDGTEYESQSQAQNAYTINSHQYGDWETVDAATIFTAGTKRKTCEVCGATVDDSISRPDYAAPTVKAYKKYARITVASKTGAASYTIVYKKAGGYWKTVKASAGTKTIKNLVSGKKYSFKIIATNGSNVSRTSKTTTVKIK